MRMLPFAMLAFLLYDTLLGHYTRNRQNKNRRNIDNSYYILILTVFMK